MLTVVSVSGHPFSGDEVTVEKHASNVIGPVRDGTVRVYRDSVGRTRFAIPIPDITHDRPPIVIHDPIAGVDYTLDEKNKIAYRLTFPGPRPEVRSTPFSLNINGIPIGAPATQGQWAFFANGREVRPQPVTSLGERIIEGLSATGSRTGGTDSPSADCEFPFVSEVWYASELEMPLVQSWSHCLGSTVSRLVNISRAEPDPSFFAPPRNYKIIEREWTHGPPAGPAVPPMPRFEFPKLPPPPTN